MRDSTTVNPVGWKGLEELRAEMRGGASRRDFLALMGFTLGASACSRRATQYAMPFVAAREDLTPGVPNWYATTCGGCSASCSLLVKSIDGRPIKIEGNPDDPLFAGGTCAVGQATVLSLYDGQRLRQPRLRDRPTSWEEVDGAVETHLARTAAAKRRIVLLSRTITSPSTRDLIGRWSQRHAGFLHVVYEPVPCDAIRQAHGASFDRVVLPHFRFDRAAAIVGLEADFLGTWISPVEFT